MSTPPTSKRLLVCSSDPAKTRTIQQRFSDAGYHVESVTDADNARQLLWQEHYSGIAVDLLLADQDGISFALELRKEHPWLPVLVLNTQADQQVDNAGDHCPDWLTDASRQARLVFALKQAGISGSGKHARILHIEDNDDMASLVRNNIGEQLKLFRARTVQEAQIALSLRSYDLVLVNSQRPILDPIAARRLASNTLLVNNAAAFEPLLTVLDSMHQPCEQHKPAHC